MRQMTLRLSVCLALFAAVRTVRAQRPSGIEIGFDGVIERKFSDPAETIVEVPVPLVRVGFPLSRMLSLEPSLFVSHNSEENWSSTFTDVGLGLLIHFRPNRTAPQPYLRPFVELGHGSFHSRPISESLSSSSTSTSVSLGAGLGVKLPLAAHFAARFEGNFSHTVKDDFSPSLGNTLGALFGFSFYTSP